jgi:hypothetical protein
VRDRIVELATADSRIVAGAMVGSPAVGGDRGSDLDLTFAGRDGVPALLDLAGASLVRSLQPDELARALAAVIEQPPTQAEFAPGIAAALDLSALAL